MGRRRKFKLKVKVKRPKGQKKAPEWIELPRDVTANILQRLGAFEILQNAQKVCTTWRTVCLDPIMWRVIDLRDRAGLSTHYDLDGMCRQAVDRSQGNLIDLNIEGFGDDEMLHYTAERSGDLRRLTLADCLRISGKGLSKALKKFPQLEELHLIIVPEILAVDVENIGNSCPMLKSFTFNERGHKIEDCCISDDELVDDIELNEHAVAIGKSMPNLCHLRLFATLMKNEGLQAILDGCPKLESLDLRQCYFLDLRGDLGKRCAQQIKHLRRPHDSVDDYEWDDGQSPPYSPVYSSSFSYQNYGPFACYDSYECFDDYTDPFGSEYFPDDGFWFPDFP